MTIITNKMGLPEPIVSAVANPDYSRGRSDVTVTQLIGPPRIMRLKELHKDEVTEDASDLIYSLLGSAVHHILEKSELSMPVEERMYVEREGIVIGGMFDRLALLRGGDSKHGELQDYKVTGVYAVSEAAGIKWEWEAQLNLLAWILRENGYEVFKLTIVAILRDFRKTQVGKVAGYPECGVKMVDIPLWEHSRCEEYVVSRLALFKEAMEMEDGDALPLCTAEERWEQPSSWAVMKEGRKTALRVLDTEQEARDWWAEELNTGKIKDKDVVSIVHRPGVSTRCEYFCSVRDWCGQWKGMKGTEDDDRRDD